MSKDPFYVTWFYRCLAVAAGAMALTLVGHFLQLRPLLYAGMGIFLVAWLGAVGMVPFGAWAQFKKWFGDSGTEPKNDRGQ